MSRSRFRGDFRSDNGAPVAPEIMAALARANRGTALGYGDDSITERLGDRFSDLFETEVSVFPVATGTAANALSLAQMTPPFGTVFCHVGAHIHTDECGAPEFYTGGAKLQPLNGAHGKLTPAILTRALAATGAHGDHETKPAALSLTQATEAGTVYGVAEVARLTKCARHRGLQVHMDGARFANALVHLGCSPADMTWRAGIQMLSFGATKNGAMAAEAVIVFDRDLAVELGRRRKRAGHLVSKMRYISVQLEAYVQDGLWLRLARKANRSAARLAAALRETRGVELIHPVEANELFVRLPAPLIDRLEATRFAFHRWPGTRNVIRLVCSYDTRPAEVAALSKAISEYKDKST